MAIFYLHLEHDVGLLDNFCCNPLYIWWSASTLRRPRLWKLLLADSLRRSSFVVPSVDHLVRLRYGDPSALGSGEAAYFHELALLKPNNK